MCIGIPMQIIESNGFTARCEGRNEIRIVNMALLGEQPVGTRVLVFLDSAREILDEERATLINAALDGATRILHDPVSLDRYFPDLTGREPELPAFLREPES